MLALPAAARQPHLSLAGNDWSFVDLSPLSCCAVLAVLALDVNHISTIDLTKLASVIIDDRPRQIHCSYTYGIEAESRVSVA